MRQLACTIPRKRLAEFVALLAGKAEVEQAIPNDFNYDLLLRARHKNFNLGALRELEAQIKKPRIATDAQRSYMEDLGLDRHDDPNLTRQEAYFAIRDAVQSIRNEFDDAMGEYYDHEYGDK